MTDQKDQELQEQEPSESQGALDGDVKADQDIIADEAERSEDADDSSSEEDVSQNEASSNESSEEVPLEEDQARDDVEVEEARSVPAVPQKRASAVPLILGGVVAGAIGFGAAYMVGPNGPFYSQPQDQIDFQQDIVARLDASDAALQRLTTSQSQQDTRIAAQEGRDFSSDFDRISSQISALASEFADLKARLDSVEQRPIVEALPDEVVDAYAQEMVRMQQTLQSQREELEDMIATAQSKEAEAAALSQATVARAAISRMTSALETGQLFTSALDEYQSVTGASVPAELEQAATQGVAKMDQLTEEFAPFARVALSVGRSQGDLGDGAARVANFFKAQLNARSVAPREGSDVDAILSRAEAAVADGRLQDALSELSTLQDGPRAEMQPWIDMAQSRQDALDAVAALAEQYSQ